MLDIYKVITIAIVLLWDQI